MAIFTIDSQLIQTYQDSIDTIINELGKNCILYFPPKVVTCYNCVYDPIGQKSSNVYLNGGPAPFANGAICPLCGGDGNIASEQNRVIKMTLKWNPKDFKNYNISINHPSNICKTKTFLTYLSDIKRCDYIVIDSDQITSQDMRCYRIGEPSIVGLQQSRYIITFWERR